MNILMPSVILHGLYDYIVCFELFGDGLDTHVASVSYSGCRWMESLFLCCHFHLCVDFYDDLLFDDQRMAISTATISFPTNQTISYSRFVYVCLFYCSLLSFHLFLLCLLLFGVFFWCLQWILFNKKKRTEMDFWQ